MKIYYEKEAEDLLQELLQTFTKRPSLSVEEAKEFINKFINENYPSGNISLLTDKIFLC